MRLFVFLGESTAHHSAYDFIRPLHITDLLLPSPTQTLICRMHSQKISDECYTQQLTSAIFLEKIIEEIF